MKTSRVESSVIALAIFAVIFCVVSRTAGQLLNRPIRAFGTWRSDLLGEGSWSASLAVSGNEITGTIEPQGLSGVKTGDLSGHISAGSIQLGVISAGEVTAEFAGALTDTGIEGTYRTSSGDHGEWKGGWEADAPVLTSNTWPPGTAIIPAGDVPVTTKPRRHGIRPESYALTMQSAWRASWRAPIAYAQGQGVNALVSAVSDGGRRQNEPEIAVDWANPSHVVAGAIDYSFPGFLGEPRLGGYVSTTGGASWTSSSATQFPIPAQYDKGADPVLDFDSQGRVFYAGLVFDDPQQGQDGCSAECCDIAVVVSRGEWTNGTFAWNTPTVVSSFGPGNFRTLDKPWLAVDKVEGSPHPDNVYVTYTRSVTIGEDRCRLANVAIKRSTNGGASFGSLVTVSDDDPNEPLDDHTWSQVAIDLNGCANVIWVDKHDVIQFDQCIPNGSGGVSCGIDRPVAQINPPVNMPAPQLPFLLSWLPSMAIDNRGASPSGYIYVVWNDVRATSPKNANIYFTRSTNGGVSFQAPVPIANTAQDELFPAIAVSANHVVNVIYYRRTSQSATTFNAYVILSADAGQTWSSPVQLNDGGNISNAGQGDIGDYIGIDTANDGSNPHLNGVWMDSRRGQQDIYSVSAAGC